VTPMWLDIVLHAHKTLLYLESFMYTTPLSKEVDGLDRFPICDTPTLDVTSAAEIVASRVSNDSLGDRHKGGPSGVGHNVTE
jgi:hypothetical protein